MLSIHTSARRVAAGFLLAVSAVGAASAQKVPAFDNSSVDKSIKPCHDFDGFANNGWKKANPIPGTESRWGAFNVLDKENKEVRLKGIILDIASRKGLAKGTEEQQISDYYASFLDTVTIQKRGISPWHPGSGGSTESRPWPIGPSSAGSCRPSALPLGPGSV